MRSQRMEELTVQADREEELLRVWYQPRTSHSIYDVCDTNGTVLKTGQMESEGARIDISDLPGKEYLLLVLDGDEVLRKRVKLENPNGG